MIIRYIVILVDLMIILLLNFRAAYLFGIGDNERAIRLHRITTGLTGGCLGYILSQIFLLSQQ